MRGHRPEIIFGADIIAGFPTETEGMFENSMKIVDECGLTHLHVFPYSSRPGTPAAKMPQVNGAVIKERAKRLREKGNKRLDLHLNAALGQKAEVLIERRLEDGSSLGRSEQFTLVRMNTGRQGDIIPARLTGRDKDELIGEVIAAA